MKSWIPSLVLTIGLFASGSQATAQERTLPTGDGYSVRSMAFSPDGKLLLTGHGTYEPSLFARGNIKVWDVASGKQLARLKARYGPVDALAFSRDGATFAAGGPTLNIWDVQSRQRLRKLSQPSRTLALAFSPDGKVLATCHGGDGTRIWDPATGKQLAELPERGRVVVSAAFSGDGRTLATSAYDGKVILWDTSTWTKAKELAVRVEGARIRYCPTDHLLFVGVSPEKSPTLWDTRKDDVVTTYEVDLRVLPEAGFSPDGKLLATVDGRSLSIWDVASGERLAQVNGEEEQYGMKAVAFSPDGKLLATGDRQDDQTTMVRIFNVGELLKNEE